jgi:rhamnulokinase
MTFDPSRAKARAEAAPKPAEAPLIKTHLSFKRETIPVFLPEKRNVGEPLNRSGLRSRCGIWLASRMPEFHYLACDLGAESGRVMLGTLASKKIELRELHRFANVPLREENSLHWNIPNLIIEIKEGLRRAAATGLSFESISTDSWGVDYILFDASGAMMEPVYHYRDPRTRHGVERVFKLVTWEQIFEQTGIQYMPINTLFQLASEDPARLRTAQFLLGVGDAVNYFLSGAAKLDVSMASTFQLYHPRTKGWSEELIQRLQLPRHIFPEIVNSGSRLGPLRLELRNEIGLSELQVIATCSHDTGAAVAGVPAAGEGWAYLSSGTWSLMGVELHEPVITRESREMNFTNEVGYGGTIRLLKNLSGLWLIQECRREWARLGKTFDYATLTRLAEEAPPFVSLINPAAEEFIAPSSMPEQMAAACRRAQLPVPGNEGAYIRCALESLALLYRRTLLQLERLTGSKIERVHVVGGGSNNDLLNQFTANALQVPVFAGPAEATAMGNILIQAITLGHIASLNAGREVIRNSTVLREFRPRDAESWSEAYERFRGLCGD